MFPVPQNFRPVSFFCPPTNGPLEKAPYPSPRMQIPRQSTPYNRNINRSNKLWNQVRPPHGQQFRQTLVPVPVPVMQIQFEQWRQSWLQAQAQYNRLINRRTAQPEPQKLQPQQPNSSKTKPETTVQPVRVSVIRHTSDTDDVVEIHQAGAGAVAESPSVSSDSGEKEDDDDDDDNNLVIDVEKIDCRFTTEIKNALTKVKQNGRELKCRKCGKDISNRHVAVLRKHILGHMPKTVALYSCGYCGTKGSSKQYIQRHIKSRHMKMELKEPWPFRAVRNHVGEYDPELCDLVEECFGE